MTIKKVMKYEHDYQHAIYRCLLGKNIVFCTEKENVEAIKALNMGDAKIDIFMMELKDGTLSFNECFNYMMENKNSKYIYCFCGYYEVINEFLQANGFTPNTDYLDGNMVLTMFEDPYFLYNTGVVFKD